MIYPFNCLLCSYDLRISSPELSPENQNQSTSDSTGSTELFTSSPQFFFLCFLNLPNGTTIYPGTQSRNIESSLVPSPPFLTHSDFIYPLSSPGQTLIICFFISCDGHLIGLPLDSGPSPFYHSGTVRNEWNIYKCIAELTILLNNRTTWGPSIQLQTLTKCLCVKTTLFSLV